MQKWYTTFGNHDIVINGEHLSPLFYDSVWLLMCMQQSPLPKQTLIIAAGESQLWGIAV